MFRRVMHDYSDPVCIDMLEQVVPAMGPDSVVLIAEFCFPPQANPADLPIAAMDMAIFNMGGKERSEDGFKQILEAAGLEYVTTHRSEGGFAAIVEARLAESRTTSIVILIPCWNGKHLQVVDHGCMCTMVLVRLGTVY